MRSISVPLAFLAGLLSFVSPCVLPLVPAYLGYLSGSSLSGGSPLKRWQVFSHALLFVGGFTLVFVVLFGLPTTLLSGVLQQYSDWISRIGGAILILFGLHKLGLFTIPLLNRTSRLEFGTGMEQGYLRSILFGVTFGTGWTPCVGPLLGTVMTLAFKEPSRGAVLTLVYALGLATPFLATAALLARGVGWLRRLNRHARAIEIASGVLMIVVGILLVTGWFSLLGSLLTSITPEWLQIYL
jgi:cytochrome c-type biogenesis protein